MSARDDLTSGLTEHACCFSDERAAKMVDAHRDEVALEIGRDALRDGLAPTLARLVGEANAAKLLADYRDVVAHELAERIRKEGAYWGEQAAAGKVYRAAAKLIDPLKDKP